VPPGGCSVNCAACHAFCAPCSSSWQLLCPGLPCCAGFTSQPRPTAAVSGSPAGSLGSAWSCFLCHPATPLPAATKSPPRPHCKQHCRSPSPGRGRYQDFPRQASVALAVGSLALHSGPQPVRSSLIAAALPARSSRLFFLPFPTRIIQISFSSC
jgi:hypothetical protein